ncbi:helix-turn-helix domain-containing protein [Streptomyces prunicolor]|uniref:helix-turn-helix domain-containing protein n=1 Tax=Streptomyces prunicolor TaxID=67348 RepID=UPI0022531F44|nr:helix-turn-helix domain-containing protein [Streptomyces prunicolor]MCX5239775.1 helix-turn-helix domain-containing protein [Streptomyces prunicolor]
MTHEDEVLRVSEALNAVERIPDPEERVKTMSKVMADQVERNKDWAKQRRELVQKLKEEGLSIRKIAARVGTSPSTVQSILSGFTDSGKHRPPAKKEDAEPTEPSRE